MTTAFNPSDLNPNATLTYSNWVYTQTVSGGNGTRYISRTNNPLGSGKYYVEFDELVLGIYYSTLMGLADLTVSHTTANAYPGMDSHSIAYYTTGQIMQNGSALASFPQVVSGNVVCMAVDTTANLVWWRINGGSNWYPSGSPASGTGGYSIAGLTAGSVYISIATLMTGDKVRLNTGYDAFQYTPPSGFSGPDTAVPNGSAQTYQAFTEIVDKGPATPQIYQAFVEVVDAGPAPGQVYQVFIETVEKTPPGYIPVPARKKARFLLKAKLAATTVQDAAKRRRQISSTPVISKVAIPYRKARRLPPRKPIFVIQANARHRHSLLTPPSAYPLPVALETAKRKTRKLTRKPNTITQTNAQHRHRIEVVPFTTYTIQPNAVHFKKRVVKLLLKKQTVIQANARHRRAEVTSAAAFTLASGLLGIIKPASRRHRPLVRLHPHKDFRRFGAFPSHVSGVDYGYVFVCAVT